MYRKELNKLKEKELLRAVADRASAVGPVIKAGGREFINFSSNDYLGMAARAETARAAARALEKYGSGAGASRLLMGGTVLHARLEDALARLKRTERSVLFGSGYCANTGAIPALTEEGDAVFSDELNHASLIDGCRLSRANVYVYKHKDMDALLSLVNKTPARRKLVVTDTVFSMDGDIAPLKDIYGICREAGAMLYLDDAHGTGVLGTKGAGALVHFGLTPEPWVIQMGTLSKALGSYGAFVATTEATADWLINRAKSLIYSTALPASAVGAALTALLLTAETPGIIEKLWENRKRLARGLKGLNLDTGESETPIMPVMLKDTAEALALSKALFERGYYAPAIRPPTVVRPRLRLTVTAVHENEHIDGLIEALGAAGGGGGHRAMRL